MCAPNQRRATLNSVPERFRDRAEYFFGKDFVTMVTLDIIAFAVFAAALIICTLKGFAKIFLRLGALVVSVIAAKLFGAALGSRLFPEIIKDSKGKIPADKLQALNETLASVIATVIIFVVIFIVLRIVAGLIAKIISKGIFGKTLDRILGAITGLLVGAAAVFLLAWIVGLVASVITFFNPGSDIFNSLDSTYLIKYFM